MPPAAANRSAPSMEQHKIYLMSSQHIPQLKLCFLQCPVGHPVSPVLVAVGISEHDLLEVLSGLQLQGVDGVCQNDFHLVCAALQILDRKSTRLNSSHVAISYVVFCLKKKKLPNHLTVVHL